MKLIIGVIASRDSYYDSFKDIWIQNVTRFNRRSALKLDVYFLYCQSISTEYGVMSIGDHVYDFFCNDHESFPNILKKTVVFFQYLCHHTSFDYVLRSNVSTLFDFEKLILWLQQKPRTLFFAGTFIGNLDPSFIALSGTNLSFSNDLVHLMAQQLKYTEYRSVLDDVAISHFLFQYTGIRVYNIKRLDFTDSVIYNRCNKFDTDIFCFRFKNDRYRNEDLLMMNYIFRHLYTPFDLTGLVKKLKKPVTEEIMATSIITT